MSYRYCLAAALLIVSACTAHADPGMTPPTADAPLTTDALTTTVDAATTGAPITVVSPPQHNPTEIGDPSTTATVRSAVTSNSASSPAAVSTSSDTGTSATGVIPGDADSGVATTSADDSAADGGPSTSTSAIAPPDLAGTVVVLDPGHNGGNAAHPEIINAPVPAGFGATKPCNTTGTATDAGYPEHALTWAVAEMVRTELESSGVTVIMTRESDDGVGPCVDERAAIGNNAKADAVLSIHGDGAAASASGFFVMTASRTEATKRVDAATDELARTIRDTLVAEGFHTSTTLGANGLWQRSDLAGLTLSLRPTVMIELGNMRNPTEAKRLSRTRGQQRYAAALAEGIIAFLTKASR